MSVVFGMPGVLKIIALSIFTSNSLGFYDGSEFLLPNVNNYLFGYIQEHW